MSTITLTGDQYSALVTLARAGATDQFALDQFLRVIEKANNITRYFLKIRWQEFNTPLPPDTQFPESWPPTQGTDLTRYDRPVAKVDVLEEVNRIASNPVDIMVTKDPGGTYGWTKIDDFFIT